MVDRKVNVLLLRILQFKDGGGQGLFGLEEHQFLFLPVVIVVVLELEVAHVVFLELLRLLAHFHDDGVPVGHIELVLDLLDLAGVP